MSRLEEAMREVDAAIVALPLVERQQAARSVFAAAVTLALSQGLESCVLNDMIDVTEWLPIDIEGDSGGDVEGAQTGACQEKVT